MKKLEWGDLPFSVEVGAKEAARQYGWDYVMDIFGERLSIVYECAPKDLSAEDISAVWTQVLHYLGITTSFSASLKKKRASNNALKRA